VRLLRDDEAGATHPTAPAAVPAQQQQQQQQQQAQGSSQLVVADGAAASGRQRVIAATAHPLQERVRRPRQQQQDAHMTSAAVPATLPAASPYRSAAARRPAPVAAPAAPAEPLSAEVAVALLDLHRTYAVLPPLSGAHKHEHSSQIAVAGAGDSHLTQTRAGAGAGGVGTVEGDSHAVTVGAIPRGNNRYARLMARLAQQDADAVAALTSGGGRRRKAAATRRGLGDRVSAADAAATRSLALPPLNEVGLEADRGTRFKSAATGVPGPGAYSPSTRLQERRAPSSLILMPGEHSTDTAVRLHQSPGPIYSVNLTPVMPRVPQAAFSHKPVYDPDTTALTRLPLEVVPGPGAYKVTRARDGTVLFDAATGSADAPSAPMSHAARIPARGTQYLGHEHMRDAIGWFSPGPAAYAPTTAGDVGRNGPRPSMLGKNRDTIHAIPQSVAVGPGSYDADRAMLSAYAASPSTVVGTAPRATDTVREFKRQLYQGKEFQKDKLGLFSPGPAQYTVTQPFVHANKGASFAPHPILRPLPGGPAPSEEFATAPSREKQRLAATHKLNDAGLADTQHAGPQGEAVAM
jgi:hypothetical protein